MKTYIPTELQDRLIHIESSWDRYSRDANPFEPVDKSMQACLDERSQILEKHGHDPRDPMGSWVIDNDRVTRDRATEILRKGSATRSRKDGRVKWIKATRQAESELESIASSI